MADETKQLLKFVKEMNQNLNSLSAQINDPETGLRAINGKLNSLNDQVNHPETGLKGINGKLDSLSGDMIDVQKTTKATYELVKTTYSNNKREIDEIKNHLDLPKQPAIIH